jgi:hypothetical protein
MAESGIHTCSVCVRVVAMYVCVRKERVYTVAYGIQEVLAGPAIPRRC